MNRYPTCNHSKLIIEIEAFVKRTISDRRVICAELAGDFHLGYARQLTDKSSLLFDLAF